MLHELIASPFKATHVVLRPGNPKAIKIPGTKFAELKTAVEVGDTIPTRFVDAATRSWNLDLTDRSGHRTVLPCPAGPPTPQEFR
ncbi:hypothetical protein [Streptomyces sp. NBC_00829]|uniref:hypothetical protein n=1 Tax=Streptomyces sp. NBC_00829 TaxID=2903679 RepID=UPI00386F6FB4|nr:hypothetical protein OG293_18410 [Streptomyces sp. NBC_00829]